MGVTHKIAIGLPTNRGLKPKCLDSLLKMVAHTPVDEILVSNEGFTTAENRNWLVAQAVKRGCTHLLLTDDDMIYPEDSLERLLKAGKHIVGAKYSVRRDVEEGDNEVVEYLPDVPKDTEFFRVAALGGGLLLVDTDVFKKVPQPHFWYKINNNGAITMSNDWYFCEKAREHGFDVWLDPTIKPKHIGTYEY